MLREGMASDRLESIYGIINGTSNYILTAMTQMGRAYVDVLAQELGFAEADPTMDVGGADATKAVYPPCLGIWGDALHGHPDRRSRRCRRERYQVCCSIRLQNQPRNRTIPWRP